MDYCAPCRRTLNGTVTCPECGAYETGTVPANDRSDSAPAADPAVLDGLFSEGRGPVGPAGTPSALVPPADVPADRRRCPPRLKKYGGRTLVAATFAMLGSLATALLLPQPSAGTPEAAPSPEQASPDAPDVHVTEPPRASRSPERPATRPATRPARGDTRDRKDTGRPRATATERDSPTPRVPAVTTGPPPPVKARPTPRPSRDRPSKPASPPAATPSASPPSSPSASPTSSPLPSTTAVPETGGQPRA
jgi:hypothetical protein